MYHLNIKILQTSKKELEQKASYVVIRARVIQYLDHLGELLDNPIESIVHYTTFPKLAKNSLDCKHFVKDGELISGREPQLKDKFKNIIKLNALMAAKHKEGLSLVVPNAFFDNLNNNNKEEAKRIFVNAAIETAKEVERDDKKYSGFLGIFINVRGNKKLGKMVSDSSAKNIGINYGDLSAPSRALRGAKFAETIMGEGVGYVGNGALSERGTSAVEENLTRRTLGGTVSMFSGALNKYMLCKKLYKAESVQSGRVQNKAQRSSQHKTQNTQCNRSTVYFAVAASLSVLIIVLACVTQTYMVLAALIIPAAVGLYGWLLYKKEKGSKPSSDFRNNLEAEETFPGHKILR